MLLHATSANFVLAHSEFGRRGVQFSVRGVEFGVESGVVLGVVPQLDTLPAGY